MNCGALVTGRFCQVCGQENVETKETFWHLVIHFFNDITHYDGKFFSTIRLLLLKPGMLTAEYVRGRRTAYLHPIRMYVFTSAFFFLLYFSFFSSKEEEGGVKRELVSQENNYKRLQEMRPIAPDSIVAEAIGRAMQKTVARMEVLDDSVRKQEERQNKLKEAAKAVESSFEPLFLQAVDSANQKKKDTAKEKKVSYDILNFEFYQDAATYLSIQEELPKGKQDGLIARTLYIEVLKLNEKYAKEGSDVFEKIKDKFKHSFPTILFISLPVFAWLLKMLYIRKKLYYASHGIFAIHAYCGIFLLMLLYYTLDAINGKLDWWIFSWLEFFLGIYVLYFVYKAMRNFYGQGRLKTLLKYMMLWTMTSITMLILIVIFFAISAYRI